MAALWWLIFIFCAVNAAFLVALAETYLNYEDTTGVLNFLSVVFLYSASTKYLEKNHKVIGVGYTMLATPFVYSMVHMATTVLRTRKFEFHNALSFRRGQKRRCGFYHRLLSFQRKYSELFYMIVETIKIILQTWQANRTSKYISNFHVNQLYGIIIFINCWSTSIIHYIWERKRNHSIKARLLSVLVDAIFSFMWGVVMQGVLFWRYWRVFFDQSKIGDMLQVPETPDRELRQLLVVSRQTSYSVGFHSSQLPLSSIGSAIDIHDVVPVRLGPTIYPVHSLALKQAKTLSPRTLSVTGVLSKRRFCSPFTAVMMVWGTVVLCMSISASGVFMSPEATHMQCVDRLYPWLTRRESCVGRTINCTVLGIQGNKADIATVLVSVSPYLLGNLAFTNCPGLEIPSAIHNFSGIQTIAIRQSTLVEWNQNASISDTTFPGLQSVQLIDSHVHCKPVGMTTHQFPSSFEWLRLKSTNVEAYIHDVESAWWSTHYFHCIECGLVTLPSALDHIDDLVDLGLQDNALVSIPASTVRGKAQLRYVTLAGNPIAELSADVWSLTKQLFMLDIQRTNISSIPVEQASLMSSDMAIWAFDTPMCRSARSEARPPQVACDKRLKSA